jgi:hypothetical protein
MIRIRNIWVSSNGYSILLIETLCNRILVHLFYLSLHVLPCIICIAYTIDIANTVVDCCRGNSTNVLTVLTHGPLETPLFYEVEKSGG